MHSILNTFKILHILKKPILRTSNEPCFSPAWKETHIKLATDDGDSAPALGTCTPCFAPTSLNRTGSLVVLFSYNTISQKNNIQPIFLFMEKQLLLAMQVFESHHKDFTRYLALGRTRKATNLKDGPPSTKASTGNLAKGSTRSTNTRSAYWM